MVTEEKKRRSHNLGIYLRKLRDQRKLSLMRVEELSTVFKDKINPSYLSKAETGKLIPALPKLLTLSKIYGIKIQNFIERLDLEEGAPIDLTDITYEELKQKGIQEIKLGNLRKGLSYFEASLDLALLSKEEKTSEAEVDVAIALRNIGKLELAKTKIEDILLKYHEDKKISATAYIELSAIYSCQSHFPLAFVAIKEAENIVKGINDQKLYAHILHAKGNILIELKQIDPAIKYLREAQKLYKKYLNFAEICRVISNMAIAYIKKNNMAKARALLAQCLKIARENDFKKLIANILSHYGLCYYIEGKPGESIKYFRESNNLSRKGDYFNILFKNYYYLMKISERLLNYKESKQYVMALRSLLTKIEGTFLEYNKFKKYLEIENKKAE